MTRSSAGKLARLFAESTVIRKNEPFRHVAIDLNGSKDKLHYLHATKGWKRISTVRQALHMKEAFIKAKGQVAFDEALAQLKAEYLARQEAAKEQPETKEHEDNQTSEAGTV